MSQKIKPWSISTTVRNPLRLADFLEVLRDHFEGRIWDNAAQRDFQARLIQRRMYGAYNKQFYGGLSEAQIDLMEGERDLTIEEAQEIFDAKHYRDPAMRGRTSFKPLQKFGFASLSSNGLIITPAGQALLSGSNNNGPLFLRALLKWQLPNILDKRGFPESDGYNLKPFVSTLHLIREVNRVCTRCGEEPTGISQTELAVFALTMIRWDAIADTAQIIVEARKKRGHLKKWEQDQQLLDARNEYMPNFDMQHVEDYADNVIRYFRMSGLLRLRGNGRLIDLEPVRRVEIESLLEDDSGKPKCYSPAKKYGEELADPTLPLLPWETREKLVEVAILLLDEIEQRAKQEIVNRSSISGRTVSELKFIVVELRNQRDHLVSGEAQLKLAEPEQIRKVADDLRLLLRGPRKGMQKSIALEWLVTSGLIALNDAEEIKPNYPKGDDGLPVAHAPGGKPDIECFYTTFFSICEVTMATGTMQWVREGQPVMRHLRDFEKVCDSEDKEVFALFVAPSIHRDTINTFWFAVTQGYEGHPQRIVPLSIELFCRVLEVCAERRSRGRALTNNEIGNLFQRIVTAARASDASTEWYPQIPNIIVQWKQDMELVT